MEEAWRRAQWPTIERGLGAYMRNAGGARSVVPCRWGGDNTGDPRNEGGRRQGVPWIMGGHTGVLEWKGGHYGDPIGKVGGGEEGH